MMELPIYQLLIDDEGLGVEYVALVDDPAIQRNWVAFDKQQKFKADNERRIISGPLMIADLPIYRRDEMGEYYAVFSKETIEKIVCKFFKQSNTSNVNLMHDPKRITDGVYMIESFLIDESRGIKTPEGFSELTQGSWFGSFKVENDEVWDNYIKTGEFKGFSIEGMFKHKLERSEEEKKILEEIDAITQMCEILEEATEAINGTKEK